MSKSDPDRIQQFCVVHCITRLRLKVFHVAHVYRDLCQ